MIRRWLLLASAALMASCATLSPAPAGPQRVVVGAETPTDVAGLIRHITSKSVTAKGKRLAYTVEVFEHVYRTPAGEPEATAVTFSYIISNPAPAANRPVIFVFNGGPGSSSVWQHLGFYGPRRIKLDDPVHPPVTPPFALEDNPHTLLDIADVVFIDPVGTGHARLLKPEAAKTYYGVDQDAVAVAQLMEGWLTRHSRWNAPKFVAGESYGTTRAAALARNLMGGPLSQAGRMMAISLNGIIVLGPSLSTEDRALQGPSNLPSAAAAAWHHKRSGQGQTLDTFMADVAAFIRDEYAPALADANLAADRKAAIVTRLAAYTGLSQEQIEKADLQPGLDLVRANLLKHQGLRLGAYDARYTLPASNGIGPPDPVADDPAMGQYSPAFIAGLQLYTNELGLKVERPYDAIAFDAVNFKWDYTPAGRAPKTPLQSMVAAMNRNADLGLFIGVGWYDFVTTAGGAESIVRAIGLGPGRITLKKYASGHMPYLGEASATQLEIDLRAFIAAHVTH